MMIDSSNHHKLVFIGGLHKSGTSLLFQCLRDHPQVSGFKDTGVSQDEGQHLQAVYPPARVYGGPGKFGFHPQAHLTEESPLANGDSARELFSQWPRYWDLSKDILLEKSPPNLLKTRFLQALLPGAYFIIILRHPIAVSLATRRWSKTSLYSLLDHWWTCHQIFDADRPFIENLLVVKYEHWVTAPEQVLQKIYSFLDLANVPCQRPIRSNLNRDYYARWKQPNRRPLSCLYNYLLSHCFEKRVEPFGYSMIRPEVVKAYPLQ